jgi:hypothetical protein
MDQVMTGRHSPTVPVTHGRSDPQRSIRRWRGRRPSQPSGDWANGVDGRSRRISHGASVSGERGSLTFRRVLVENLASCREWREASLPR